MVWCGVGVGAACISFASTRFAAETTPFTATALESHASGDYIYYNYFASLCVVCARCVRALCGLFDSHSLLSQSIGSTLSIRGSNERHIVCQQQEPHQHNTHEQYIARLLNGAVGGTWLASERSVPFAVSRLLQNVKHTNNISNQDQPSN